MIATNSTCLLGSALLFLLALGGCQSSAPSATLEQERHPPNGLSGNLVRNQAGAVDQPYTRYPPPIRRAYASDR